MDEVWKLERRLWLEGVEVYRELMAPECTMVFGPMGILDRTAIIDALQNVPRWSDVEMLDGVATNLANGVVSIAYRAVGMGEGKGSYNAYCTSTYVKTDDGWRIAVHQQTPI